MKVRIIYQLEIEGYSPFERRAEAEIPNEGRVVIIDGIMGKPSHLAVSTDEEPKLLRLVARALFESVLAP
jgi:hypothetical protein